MNMLQMKEDCRKQNLIKTEISNSLDKGFKVKIIKVIKMLAKFRRMDEHSENFNRGRKYRKIPKRSQRIKEYNN